MNLSKWKPWNWFKQEEKESPRPVPVRYENNESLLPVLRLQRDMDRLFDSFFKDFGSFPSLAGFPEVRMPRLDISETAEDYRIAIDVPGMTADDIDITVKDGVLRVKGERTKEEAGEEHRTERVYGMFERVLSLPDNADESTINADFKNGVLNLTVKKTEMDTSEDQARKIPISAG